MGIPQYLEQILWKGHAKSLTLTFGGGALSSFRMEEGKLHIVWGVQVFPFIDLEPADLAGLTAWQKAARLVHWFEFDSNENRHGFAHRSGYSLENSSSVPPITLPVPRNSPDWLPVYWPFRGKFLTCRITRPSQPSEFIPGTDVPPPSEQEAVLGYPPAGVSVAFQFPGMGNGASWQPDMRRTPIPPQVQAPRATADPAEDTDLHLPLSAPQSLAPFTYPLINVNLVVIDTKENI